MMKNKLKYYFFLGGLIGPLIICVLYNCASSLLNSSHLGWLVDAGWLLFIVMSIPVFLIGSFIPCSILGVLTGLFIKNFYNKVPTLFLSLCLFILGGAYSLVWFLFFDPLWDGLHNYRMTVGYRIIDMFSTETPGGGGFTLSLPPLYDTLIAIISGSVLCLTLLFIFIKVIKPQMSQSKEGGDDGERKVSCNN